MEEPAIFRYPFDEFQKHFFEINEILQNQSQRNPEIGMKVCREYFAKTGDPLWEKKMNRFVLICSYVDSNQKAFDQGAIAVYADVRQHR